MRKHYYSLLATILVASVALAQNEQPAQLPLSPTQVNKLKTLLAPPDLTKMALQSALPLTPKDIEQIRQQKDAVDRAIAVPPIPTSLLNKTSRTLNLSDNSRAPLIHLVYGYTTNLSFIGENGKPWPISTIVMGSDAIKQNQPVAKTPLNAAFNVIRPWESSNITVYLANRVTPIVLYAQTAADFSNGLDASVTVRIEGLPPGTEPLPVKNVGAVGDTLLNAVNFAPGDNWQSVKLKDTNLPFSIGMWKSPDGQQSIVRISSAALISPDWESQASNPDGTVTAYKFSYVPLMLLINDNAGKSYQVTINDSTQTIASTVDVNETSSLQQSIINGQTS